MAIPVPGFPTVPFKIADTHKLTGTPFLARSGSVGAPPTANAALYVALNIHNFQLWLDTYTAPGAHIGICLLDNKAVAPFDTNPATGRRPPDGAVSQFQWGSISTGAGAAVGRPYSGEKVIACEQFRKPETPTYVAPIVAYTAQYLPPLPQVTRIVVVARPQPTTGKVEIGYSITDAQTGAVLVPFLATAQVDNVAEFARGVSLIVVGAYKPSGEVDSPVFENVQYSWAI